MQCWFQSMVIFRPMKHLCGEPEGLRPSLERPRFSEAGSSGGKAGKGAPAVYRGEARETYGENGVFLDRCDWRKRVMFSSC